MQVTKNKIKNNHGDDNFGFVQTNTVVLPIWWMKGARIQWNFINQLLFKVYYCTKVTVLIKFEFIIVTYSSKNKAVNFTTIVNPFRSLSNFHTLYRGPQCKQVSEWLMRMVFMNKMIMRTCLDLYILCIIVCRWYIYLLNPRICEYSIWKYFCAFRIECNILRSRIMNLDNIVHRYLKRNRMV